MSREICLKPCLPSISSGSLPIHLPMGVGTVTAAESLNLEADCSGCSLTNSLMTQVQPLLTGFGPVFCILGCLGAVIDAIKSVSDALGPPPDPSKMVSALAEVATKCECVVSFVLPPPVGVTCSFLQLLRDILGILLEVLTCVSGLLQNLVTVNLRATTLLASSNSESIGAGQCIADKIQILTAILAGKMGGVSTLASALGGLLSVLSIFPGLSGISSALTSALSAFSTTISGPNLTPVQFLAAVNTLKNALTNTGGTGVYDIVNVAAAVCP